DPYVDTPTTLVACGRELLELRRRLDRDRGSRRSRRRARPRRVPLPPAPARAGRPARPARRRQGRPRRLRRLAPGPDRRPPPGGDYARIYLQELDRGRAAVALSPEELEAVERAMAG